MHKLLALFLFISLTVPATASQISAIAAVVNGDVITTNDIDHESAPFLADEAKKGTVTGETRDRLRKDALNRLIDKKLVEQKIQVLNIKVSDEELRSAIDDIKRQNKLSQEALISALSAQGLTFEQYRSQLRDQLQRLRLISQEVKSKVVISDQAIHEEYEKEASSLREEDRYRASHIFFPVPPQPTAQQLAEVMSRAVEVRQKALTGTDFSALASEYSRDPSAKDGGNLGVFRKSDMQPELAHALEGMKPGDISDLVQTPSGIHIVKLQEIIPGQPRPYEKVKAEIEERMYRQRSEERFNQWVSEIRKDATIDIRI